MITTLLLAMFLQAQAEVVVPADNSTDKTHKAKYERVLFQKDGKPCGAAVEMKDGHWRAYVKPDIHSQVMETKDEAVQWVKLYCPVKQ